MLQPHDMHTTGIKSSILKDVSKEIQGLVAVRNAQLQWVPKELRHVVDTTMSPTAPANDLPDFWSYQTCAEFAFFQTCEVNSRVSSRKEEEYGYPDIALSMFLIICFYVCIVYVCARICID